jgi:hypothetical protein
MIRFVNIGSAGAVVSNGARVTEVIVPSAAGTVNRRDRAGRGGAACGFPDNAARNATPSESPHPLHTATCPLRTLWFARCAALAALTPASAGHATFFERSRMHSTQFVRCKSSPSGLS